MNRAILLSALLLAACGSATDVVQEGDAPTSNATSRGLIEPAEPAAEVLPTESEIGEEPGETELGNVDPSTPLPPADVPTLRGLLAAHHVADLPDGDTLRGYETGEASLQWLANYGDSMATRTRALMLLEHFGTDGTRAFALDYLGHDEPQLQAAAITALAGQDLDAAPDAVDAIAAAPARPRRTSGPRSRHDPKRVRIRPSRARRGRSRRSRRTLDSRSGSRRLNDRIAPIWRDTPEGRRPSEARKTPRRLVPAGGNRRKPPASRPSPVRRQPPPQRSNSPDSEGHARGATPERSEEDAPPACPRRRQPSQTNGLPSLPGSEATAASTIE